MELELGFQIWQQLKMQVVETMTLIPSEGNGRKTITDSVKCNDGIMKLEIISQEISGGGGKKHDAPG